MPPDRRLALTTDQFIRRFLSHVLPKGFQRIRHYGLLANGNRDADLARARQLLAMPPPVCPACGGPMVIIETFAPGAGRALRRAMNKLQGDR